MRAVSFTPLFMACKGTDNSCMNRALLHRESLDRVSRDSTQPIIRTLYYKNIKNL